MTEQTGIGFEEALRLSEELLLDIEESGFNESQKLQLSNILSNMASSRGFFVSYLTGDSILADDPPDFLLEAFKESEIVPDLLAKNLVMSTTMEITHRRKESVNNEAGSKLVKERTSEIIRRLKWSEMRKKLSEMRFSIRQKTGVYNDFLKRWNYDDEQLAAATAVIESLL